MNDIVGGPESGCSENESCDCLAESSLHIITLIMVITCILAAHMHLLHK